MTSNIEKISNIANTLIGKHVTVHNKPHLGLKDSVLLVESGICTEVIAYFNERGNTIVNFAVDELKTELRYPRGGHVEVIREGWNTDYQFPLDKLTRATANSYPGRAIVMFDAPSSDYLAGSTWMYFRTRD
ncbi:hypothetical protein RAAC3_TM7C00001G0577 [Candidatus Saccharibacteria bacterium RAAC3_TM7_1]|nr:hypothetical protein RAAC3_TM7C00001G0577 [Candidatus Saccharibacteria bacterium RAAC3_TM7_1]HCZ28428.1 hypothetical protein [Candidatus Saccharibacteria bacterium]